MAVSHFNLGDIESLEKTQAKELREKAIERVDDLVEVHFEDYALCINPSYEVEIVDFDSVSERREKLSSKDSLVFGMICELVGTFMVDAEDTENFRECMPPNIHPDTELEIDSDALEDLIDNRGDQDST